MDGRSYLSTELTPFPDAEPWRTTGKRREGVGDRIGPPPIRTLLAFCYPLRRAGPRRPKGRRGPAHRQKHAGVTKAVWTTLLFALEIFYRTLQLLAVV